MDSATRWTFNQACQLHWQHWAEDYILFNAASNQTHYLSAIGFEILSALQRQAFTAQALSEHIAKQYNWIADAELSEHIKTTLHNMDELGLIEPE